MYGWNPHFTKYHKIIRNAEISSLKIVIFNKYDEICSRVKEYFRCECRFLVAIRSCWGSLIFTFFKICVFD